MVKNSVTVVEGAWLQSLKAQNFALFKGTTFEFSPHLNLVIGENAAGKSQLLKLAYSMCAASHEGFKKQGDSLPTKEALESLVADKLNGVFRPEKIGHLMSWDPLLERSAPALCQVELACFNADYNYGFYFGARATTKVSVAGLPQRYIPRNFQPVFMPPRELLTLYPNFVATYESRFFEFEETYRDLCLQLGVPALKTLDPPFKALLKSIEKALGAKVIHDKNGRFYLKYTKGKPLEMPLVAEGHQKIAMIAQLLANGSLQRGTPLFWDEPEANLNPKLLKHVAQIIYDLANQGIQTFIATHSLFLMRELEILHENNPHKASFHNRVITLAAHKEEITVHQSDSFEDMPVIVSLDEELIQSDRFMEAFNPS